MKNKLVQFTLTELLVVITVMVILLGIGVGSLRDLRGVALYQMGDAEMKAALKRGHRAAVRNKVPTVITLTATGPGISQGYLQVASGEMTQFFDFDKFNDNGDEVQGLTGSVNITSADLVDGFMGNGIKKTDSLPLPSGTTNAFYMEAMVRKNTGSGDLLEIDSQYKIIADADSYVKAQCDSVTFGLDGNYTEIAYIGGENWTKVGLLVNKVENSGSAFFYINGQHSGSYSSNVAFSSNSITLDSCNINNNTELDNIKFYDYSQSEVVVNDLKAGFFVSPHLSSSTLSAGQNPYKQIVLGGDGELLASVWGGNVNETKKEDFIALGSMHLTGKVVKKSNHVKNIAHFENPNNWKNVPISGKNMFKCPERGYLLVKGKSVDEFELIKYKDMDGETLTIEAKNLGGTASRYEQDASLYFAEVVFFDKSGRIR